MQTKLTDFRFKQTTLNDFVPEMPPPKNPVSVGVVRMITLYGEWIFGRRMCNLWCKRASNFKRQQNYLLRLWAWNLLCWQGLWVNDGALRRRVKLALYSRRSYQYNMAKKPTLSSLRTKEWTLSSKIRQKTEEYRRRKEALLAERDRLEELRESIADLRSEHRELRDEIKEIEGYWW